MSIQVIGAGFGRTGTKSLKLALERLLGGPCFHMLEMFEGKPELFPRWLAKAEGEEVDLREVLAGYRATVDWPSCTYYAELAELYPEAKVILTVRDPERWYQSVKKTIYAFSREMAGPPVSWVMQVHPTRWAMPQMAERQIWGERGHFGGRFEDKAHAISVYEAHIEEVKATIPKERLLVYALKEGWEPLCDFLGVPVPSEPLPNTNSSEEMVALFTKLRRIAWLASPITAPGAFVARRLRRR